MPILSAPRRVWVIAMTIAAGTTGSRCAVGTSQREKGKLQCVAVCMLHVYNISPSLILYFEISAHMF